MSDVIYIQVFKPHRLKEGAEKFPEPKLNGSQDCHSLRANGCKKSFDGLEKKGSISKLIFSLEETDSSKKFNQTETVFFHSIHSKHKKCYEMKRGWSSNMIEYDCDSIFKQKKDKNKGQTADEEISSQYIIIEDFAGAEKEEDEEKRQKNDENMRSQDSTIEDIALAEKEKNKVKKQEIDEIMRSQDTTIEDIAGGEKEEDKEKRQETDEIMRSQDITIEDIAVAEKEEDKVKKQETDEIMRSQDTTIEDIAGGEKEEDKEKRQETDEIMRSQDITIEDIAGGEKEEDKNKGQEADVNDANVEETPMTDGVTEKTRSTTGSKLYGFVKHVFLAVLILMKFIGAKGPDPEQQEDFCELFHSYLNNATGPFNASMCNIRLQSIHCPMGDIKKCFPFVENNAEFYAGCIQNSTSLDILSNDGHCLFVTMTKESNDVLAQCYSQNCHRNFYEKTTMAAPSTTQKTINGTTGAGSSLGDGGSRSGSEAGVVVAVVFILIIVVVVLVVGVVFYIRNQFGFKDKVQQCITDVEKGDPPEQAQPMIQHGNGDTESETQSVEILQNGSHSGKFTVSGEKN